ncbi:MAG: tungstate ABC transporter substrate-binding protein WtpA [Archaeoglobaceae archaeon]
MRKLAILVVLLCTLMFCCIAQETENKIKIFHAGSLSVPISELSREFQKKYGVDVFLESSGSIEAVRKVTDLKKSVDIIAVADYFLIPQMLIPNYTDFYILFAGNEMVIAFSGKSKYSEIINETNWFEILQRDDVTFGFSDPNMDPCGYRALAVLKLADLYYKKSIFEMLVERNSNIRSSNNTIFVPEKVESNSKIVLRPKEVELTALVETGALDYYFIYKSVAKQHNLSFVELPAEINLGNYELIDYYSKVDVYIRNESFKIQPIAYAVTILKNSQNKNLAIEYLNFMLSDEGRKIFKDNFHELLDPPVIVGIPPDGLVIR